MNNETKKGKLVPELRFPGFEGEWEEKKFNDIFSLLSNNTCSRAEMDNNAGVALNVHYGDILTKYNEILDVKKTNIPYVTDNELLIKYKDSFLQDGDIIISDTAEDSTVGKCTEIQNHQEIIILSGLHTIPVRPQRKFAKGYLGYFLNSESYHNQLLPLMQGVKVSSISRTAIKKTEIFFPSLPEQQKIAECLSSVDNLIQAEADQLQALKDHKKGLMQQIFPQEGETTPKLRFPGFEGEWEEKKLGECLLQTPDYGLNAPAVPFSDNLPVYLRITDISDDGKYIKDGKVSVATVLTKDNSLQEGDIVFARTGASVGKTYKYRVEDGLLVFAGFLIRIKPDETQIDSEFLFQYTQTKTYKKWVEVTSTRSGQPGINSLEISSLLILFPSLPEQQKIASCFSSLDEGIAAQQRKVEALKEHKKGLMQKLFPTIN